MRSLGFRSHVVLSLIAAAGVVMALNLPWFGTAPKGGAYIDGPMDRTLEEIGRAVSASDGLTGRETLGTFAAMITALACFTALTAVLCLSSAVFGVAREGLRLGALATLGVIAWRLVDHPADELRHGALVASACALVLTSSALSVAAAPMRRKRQVFGHPGVYVPPPAPPVWDSGESAPPPSHGRKVG